MALEGHREHILLRVADQSSSEVDTRRPYVFMEESASVRWAPPARQCVDRKEFFQKNHLVCFLIELESYRVNMEYFLH